MGIIAVKTNLKSRITKDQINYNLHIKVKDPSNPNKIYDGFLHSYHSYDDNNTDILVGTTLLTTYDGNPNDALEHFLEEYGHQISEIDHKKAVD